MRAAGGWQVQQGVSRVRRNSVVRGQAEASNVFILLKPRSRKRTLNLKNPQKID
jgi:hypothetical protein